MDFHQTSMNLLVNQKKKRKNNMKKIFFLILLFSFNFVLSQERNLLSNTLSLDEYLGFVKQFHPFVKQANLEVSQAQAGIMQARGGFDPKIEVDFETKQFKNSEYFSLLNSTFKIPTWYGIEVKAGFDQTEGVFLNPQNTNPVDGLVTLGIAIPLGQGLFINNRMAALRQAKIFNQLTRAERDLQVTNILFDASLAYFDWYRNYAEYKLYETFLNNAKIRFDGIKILIKEGDRPAIDSIEAGIIVRNRTLNLEQSRIKLIKSTLELSNFLWLENNIPLELQEGIIPEENLENKIENTLRTNSLFFSDLDLSNHPKIRALQNKVSLLEVDKKLKGNMLLPKLDFNYNYLSEPVNTGDFNTLNYKYGVNFSFPLFLRKERGSFKMAKFKLQSAQLDLDLENLNLKNKIDFQIQEIASLKDQMNVAELLVTDFTTMLNAEERLFGFGESSIFLINTRENSLLSASLQNLDIKLRFLNSNANLFKSLANPLD